MNTEEIKGYYLSASATKIKVFSILSNFKLYRDNNSTPGYLSPANIDDNITVNDYFQNLAQGIKRKKAELMANENIYFEVFVEPTIEKRFRKDLENDILRRSIIREFYNTTKLLLNFLDSDSLTKNVQNLFPSTTENDTIVVNVGDLFFEMYYKHNDEYMYKCIELGARHASVWGKGIQTSDEYEECKKEVIKKFENELPKNSNFRKAIILKNELSYMEENCYPLEFEDDVISINLNQYKKRNIDIFLETSNQKDENRDFQYGHLLMEAIFEFLGVTQIIPRNENPIQSTTINPDKKITVCGSVNKYKEFLMEEIQACENAKLEILGPMKNLNKSSDITQGSEYEHLKAIEECDILYVCNKDKRIGQATSCHIYYASALMKRILFLKEVESSNSNDSLYRMKHMPHDVLDKESIKEIL
ncbi:hypothetical protein I6N96_05095 [Enterococcus sp. BWM-S5]|uniref:Uncharacterized protein n=1 Tax=Enterococcus larvae TaxID=2794352 RepID=A0ABS4CG87_9ENTE|nr:hypothetical protein [Enterococcus larvae]MBP1045645.1 hypothetical protein [Enterococcus larvae]